MKVAVSRGGDSDDDSFHEAPSSRRSSSRDQLSDVSTLTRPPARWGGTFLSPGDLLPTFSRHCQPLAQGPRGSHEGFVFAISVLPSLKRDFSLIRTSPLGVI